MSKDYEPPRYLTVSTAWPTLIPPLFISKDLVIRRSGSGASGLYKKRPKGKPGTKRSGRSR